MTRKPAIDSSETNFVSSAFISISADDFLDDQHPKRPKRSVSSVVVLTSEENEGKVAAGSHKGRLQILQLTTI